MKVGWPGSGNDWVIREQASSGYKRGMGRNGSSARRHCRQSAGMGDLELELIYAEKCLQLYTLVRRDIAETRPARETKIPMHYFSCFPFCFVDN